MRHISRLNPVRVAVFGALLVGATFQAWGQNPYFLLPGMHPAFSLTNMRPMSGASYNLLNLGNNNGSTQSQPNTGAMAWLPDGRLFIASNASSGGNWNGDGANILGPSRGYIFSGLTTATTAADVTVDTAGSSFHLPSGAVILGDTIYTLDNQDGLTMMVPTNGKYVTRQTVYKGLLGAINTTFPGDRRWDGGLVYKDGYFYAPVGMALLSGPAVTNTAIMIRGRGTVLKIKRDGSTVDTLVAGVRNPVAMSWGPDSAILMTDNQGSFRPAGGIWEIKGNQWFGHLMSMDGSALASQPLTPPAVIVPYGNGGSSSSATDPTVTAVPTDLLTLRNGPYKNQMLLGNARTTGMNRVFLEKVNGSLQGAVFPFAQGLGLGGPSSAAGVIPEFRANVLRMAYGPDGRIYLGGGGGAGTNSGSGSWGFDNANLWGLARLDYNGDSVFEMKAIRSKGPTTLEIEFTEKVTPSTVIPSNFTVTQADYAIATNNNYGAGEGTHVSRTVTAATLDGTGTRVTLTVTGLLQRSNNSTGTGRSWGYVTQVRSLAAVTAVSGRAAWSDTASARRGLVGWYTLNTFGPGDDVGNTTAIARGDAKGSRTGLLLKVRADGISVRAPVEGAWTMRTLDTRGRVLSEQAVAAGRSEYLVPTSALVEGVTLLEARAEDGRRFTASASKP
ncbi:MAG TPA: hypothetical protein VHO02_03570 [Fibrobacteria bacterium]|jgi:hypothetical protein|nr:hypothetical protein [Fibrobacteria bacterium]